MKQALFFVTSISGIRKAAFKKRLQLMIEDGDNVQIIISMLNFDDSQYAKSELLDLVKQFGGVRQTKINQLFDLFRNTKGIDHSQKEAQFDLEPYSVAKGGTRDHPKFTYSDENGRVVAEMIEALASSGIYKLVVYDGAKIAREIYYDRDEIPVALQTFGTHGRTNLKLLNKEGQVSVSFDSKPGGPNRVYNLNKTSVIKPPVRSKPMPRVINSHLRARDVNSHVGNQKHLVKGSQGTSFIVLDYADSSRFGNLASFNVSLIDKYSDDKTSLFIDLKDTLDFSAYLNRQVVFNY